MKVAIIDDEQYCIGALESMLAELMDNIEIVGKAQSVNTGIELVQNQDIDLLFLDIKLRGGTGFDILEQVKKDNISIVFTTAYSQYAIQAFEYAAIHYLLKPIDEEDLAKALERYHKLSSKQLDIAKDNLDSGKADMLVVNSTDEATFIKVSDILYFEAQSNYCVIHQTNGQNITSSKTLKNYEELLQHKGFYRIHSKYMVNLQHVLHYTKGRNAEVVLFNNLHLDIAKRRKKEFVDMFNDIKKT